MKSSTTLLVAAIAALAGGLAHAQPTRGKGQVVKPPQAQAWIDVATFSGMGMGMPGLGGGNPMAMLGGLFGGGGGRNEFGRTTSGMAGSWLDVTLHSRANPNLAEATQFVPEGSKLAPSLQLLSPRKGPAAPVDDERVVEDKFEPPKGKIFLYWGCGDTVRPGQPRVLDMSRAGIADYQKFFIGRRATQRGAHSAVGRPHWPNEEDARLMPAGASLVGEHAFKGQGVPDDFKFRIGAAQDIMPPIELNQRDLGGATRLDWKGIPTARAYFIAGMGTRGNNENEMVFWSSSEVPETGSGLVDYQTNPAVDRWLKEKVLLSPEARQCTVPKGIFGEGAMLRMVAYGTELNLVHPPRPADARTPWEPHWAAKIRVKSVANAMLGMEGMMNKSEGSGSPSPGREYSGNSRQGGDRPPEESNGLGGLGEGLNKLKGLFSF